jgi:cytochrome c2
MRRPHTLALGAFGLAVLAVMGVLVFAAGGIVARHQITPLVAVVDAAEANVKNIVKSLKGESSNEEYFTTAYYHLKMTTHETSDTGAGDNVAFARLADGYLVGQRAGALKYVEVDEEANKVSVQPLSVTLPTNKDEFLKDAANANSRLQIQFGVKDLLVQNRADELRLFATHQYWYPDQDCSVMRLSVLKTTAEGLMNEKDPGEWKTVYETQPCLGLDNSTDHNNHDNAFLQSGGRLDLLDDNTLLLTVGENFMDSMHNENLVQDPNASYGKIFRITLNDENLKESEATMVSLGHRNPQGLHVDQMGNIWSTEHGPRGGDELNLVEEGRNYGWPHVSYGTDYAGVDWPSHLQWAQHEGYDKPVFAWLPSIGINNLIRLENSGFPLWEGNLIIGALKDQAIHRLILDDKHVVARERINIGSRVRDMMQTESDKLILLSDDGKLILVEALDDSSSEQMPLELQASKLWVQCDSCHTVESGAGHSLGPNLNGIVGSDIAHFEDYDYSEALRNLEGKWTPSKLDEFLRDPQAFAPGTKMAFSGIENAEDRQLLIQYLQSQ